MDNNESHNLILLVDAGNSSVKWAMKTTAGMLAMQRSAYPEQADENFFINSWSACEKPEKVFLTCVAGERILLAIEKACMLLWSIQVERVTAKGQERGLTNAYTDLVKLGSDRWCAMIAAYSLTKSNIVVVDCGSAITIDVINNMGLHMGGYILPGLYMMKQSLSQRTAEIKSDKSDQVIPSVKPATSTMACIDSGVCLASISAIEYVLAEQQNQLGELKCFLTGGDADSIAGLLSVKCQVVPNLVLHGLAVIAELNDTLDD